MTNESKWPWIAVFVICLLVLIFAISNAETIDLADLPHTEHRAEAGETLWDLSREYAPDDVHQQLFITYVRDLNNMTCPALKIGQTLKIPDGR